MPPKTRNQRGGRATPPQSAPRNSGRYTPPIPREVRHSPRWYPWALLSLLLGGVAVIIFDYIQLLPDSPSNWYTLGGLIAILIAALAATRFR